MANLPNAARTHAYLTGLIGELVKLADETEYVEFKVNNGNPAEIGEYISALANSAALMGKAAAYVAWGIENGSHRLVGTDFRPRSRKVKGEELENWLLRKLSPKLDFTFFELDLDGTAIVLLEIKSASGQPVQFEGVEYIRVGSYKQKLKEFPEKERALWRIFDRVTFEQGAAMEHASDETVLELLEYPEYFSLTGRTQPELRTAILEALAEDSLIRPCDAGGWDITNLGAVLLARRLSSFRVLGRKAMRVIEYSDNSRLHAVREKTMDAGYAATYEALVELVGAWTPSNEVVERALRKTVPMYPTLAVRELVANALIHQDFSLTGTGPMIEIFTDRIEITNPGEPLMETDRFLDTPPKSRNETLTSLMRRMGICEERGSGIDRVVAQIEISQLPAPLFEVTGSCTRAVLFAHRHLAKMDRDDRVRACYLHACLRYVNREFLTNASLRERFGIEAKNAAMASRLIKDALAAGVIGVHDSGASPKFMKYVPWWVAGLERPGAGTQLQLLDADSPDANETP